jgi:rubrerythrin
MDDTKKLPENVNEILDFAIKREEEANKFYLELAARVDRPEIKKVFTDFASEELGHKAKLEKVKKGEYGMPGAPVPDLMISDYIVDVMADPNFDYQDVLIVAMKKEKASFRLYNDLAQAVKNPELSKLFRMLAMEEARHKLRFELEYDEHYLPEN